MNRLMETEKEMMEKEMMKKEMMKMVMVESEKQKQPCDVPKGDNTTPQCALIAKGWQHHSSVCSQ